MLDRGDGCGALFDDGVLRFQKKPMSAASYPLVQSFGGFAAGRVGDRARAFVEEVSPGRVDLIDQAGLICCLSMRFSGFFQCAYAQFITIPAE